MLILMIGNAWLIVSAPEKYNKEKRMHVLTQVYKGCALLLHLHELEQCVDGLDLEDLGRDRVIDHAALELVQLQLLVAVGIALLEHLGHHRGKVNLEVLNQIRPSIDICHSWGYITIFVCT